MEEAEEEEIRELGISSSLTVLTRLATATIAAI
jgi:hypothetical protein